MISQQQFTIFNMDSNGLYEFSVRKRRFTIIFYFSLQLNQKLLLIYTKPVTSKKYNKLLIVTESYKIELNILLLYAGMSHIANVMQS